MSTPTTPTAAARAPRRLAARTDLLRSRVGGVYRGDRRLRAAAAAAVVYTIGFLACTLVFGEDTLAGRILTEIVYPIPEATAVVMLVLAARRSHRVPRFWYLSAAGMACGLIGDVNWAVYDFLLGAPPTPSAGDIAYTAQPLVFIVALVAAYPVVRPRRGQLADLAIPFAAIIFIAYDAIIEPQLTTGVSAATIPAIAETLVTIVAALLYTTALAGYRHLSSEAKLAFAGVFAFAVSYPLYTYAASLSTWQHTNWLYTGFQAAFLLYLLGAYTRYRRGEPGEAPVTVDSDVNVWLITAGLALVLGSIVVTMHDGRLDSDAPWVGLGAITLVIVRMHQIVRRRGTLAAKLGESLRAQERLASTDALTETANRRAFDLTLRAAVTVAEGGGVGLAIFDLDRFKAINDRYGHPAGDEVLQSVAARVRGVIRAGDTLARIGGEEFAVVAPSTRADELAELAERCRLAVCAHPFAIAGTQITVTTSIGIAHYPTSAASGGELVRIADRSLYAAKGAGRNRIGADGRTAERPATLDMTALAFLERLADQLNVEHGNDAQHRAMRRASDALCDELGVSAEQRQRCALAARLHDIGKVGVPADLLEKTETITDAERRVLQEHVRVGVDLLRRCDETFPIAHIIGDMRERPDGRGYPAGKTGEQIPLEAKILAVADAWTAMLADRPYRPALSYAQARRQLLAGRGSQFDEQVVDAALRIGERSRAQAA